MPRKKSLSNLTNLFMKNLPTIILALLASLALVYFMYPTIFRNLLGLNQPVQVESFQDVELSPERIEEIRKAVMTGIASGMKNTPGPQ